MDVSSGILHKVHLFQTIHWTMCAIVQRLQSLLAQYTCTLMNNEHCAQLRTDCNRLADAYVAIHH